MQLVVKKRSSADLIDGASEFGSPFFLPQISLREYSDDVFLGVFCPIFYRVIFVKVLFTREFLPNVFSLGYK